MTPKDDNGIQTPASQEDEEAYSLEEILAEYGGSLEDHLLHSNAPKQDAPSEKADASAEEEGAPPMEEPRAFSEEKQKDTPSEKKEAPPAPASAQT